MNKISKLSIIVPVYMAEKYLQNTLESILLQEYTNIEVILVNDGSTDRSLDICYEFSKRDKRIKVIDNDNHGVSYTRNCGLAKATGDYVTFIDADDYIDKHAYSNLMKEIMNNTSDVILFGATFEYHKNDRLIKECIKTISEKQIINKEQLAKKFKELYDLNYLSPVWNKIFKKEILDENNIKFNEFMNVNEDLDFSIKSLTYCDKICIYDKPYYHYRIDKSILSLSRRSENNYINNFDILKNSLENMMNMIEFDSITLAEIYSIIFRGYLVELEVGFIKSSNWKKNLRLINEFIENRNVRYCIGQAKSNNRKLKIILLLFKKRLRLLILLTFSLKRTLEKIIYR